MSVSELSEKLFVSEATVRRDVAALQKKELVVCKRGRVSLKTGSPDRRIPLFVRDLENIEEKRAIGIRAAALVRDGDVVMLDASTTALAVIPHLSERRNVLVITNGAKTALESASMGIRTVFAGGEMTPESFCTVGAETERLLSCYNADVAFFSCRGIDDEGRVTDTSVYENAVRRIMMENSRRCYLLCDTGKFGKRYLNTLCRTQDVDGVISER
jgi:DeoR/GlpR family transcriptional regulator of sugar metabolism